MASGEARRVRASGGGGGRLTDSRPRARRRADGGARAQVVRTLEGHTGSVYAVAVSPDGQFVYSGSSDNTVKQWRADTGEASGGARWGRARARACVASSS
jgi:WD40 repeat protein